MRQKSFLITLALLCACLTKINAAASTSKGTAFWVGFMENVALSANGTPAFSFFVYCDVNTSGTIALPATGYTQAFTANAGQVSEVQLPAGVFYATGSEAVANYGILVTTADPVSLTVLHERLYHHEATIVLPIEELDDEYMVMAHKDDLSASGAASEFVIVATEDNTTIDIVPSALTLGLRPAGASFSVTLNKGETYQVQSYGELTGTSVIARDNKKIAVFSGANYANIDCLATDHLYEQNYPVQQWGTEYIVEPMYVGPYDVFRILAANDSTKIFFECYPSITLNKGKYYDFPDSYVLHLTSTQPIQVGQFKRGQDCSYHGDCSFVLCRPLNYVSYKSVFAAMVSSIPSSSFDQYFVDIISPVNGASVLTLDGAPVPLTIWCPRQDYRCARIPLTAGTHTIVSDSGFYAYAYGLGNNDAYSFSTGYDATRTIAPQQPLSITHTQTLCSNHTGNFIANVSFAYDSLYWNFGDGSTSTQTQSPAIHTYTASGTYTVTLLAADSGNCNFALAQDEITIEHCIDSVDCEIFVPTAFSPNGDTYNDKACVYGGCIKEIDFAIYDRWGECVFRTTDPKICWDGTYKDKALNDDVFAWVLKATTYGGKEIKRTGNISLIR